MPEFIPPREPEKDLGLLAIFILMLGVIWYVQGGAERLPNPSGPIFEERTIEGKKTNNYSSNYSSGSKSQEEIQPASGVDFTLRATQAKQTDPQKEYIEISLAKKSGFSVNITGWTLEGNNGLRLKIPQAAPLVIANQVDAQLDVVLEPGGKVVVATGQSPRGVSFRLNKCTGYFEQSQDFSPSLPQACPYPRDEQWSTSLSEECLDYISKLPRCRANFSIPWTLGNDCISVINQTVNYNKCVELHRNDVDFYKPEWRIYLNRTSEMWRSKWEMIVLRDARGEKVASVSY